MIVYDTSRSMPLRVQFFVIIFSHALLSMFLYSLM